ncbi:ABC-F family ATP-binding cassette domain-containing protein [Paenisporosarcina cavernae]|uniref:ATP-binding cassette domain-containing protein n=1 Tax=Paenisporosarcina cavernae TaxID=2320858 RepID=A0A385YY04_9BACL|nr:ABC-F family ATP-binding cassette domain-containing protein [Paenisporosarcina cavernae]AYC30342.1 ATP-binding cassette domain-containing protein [Paenisporosarcina cavernae]
MYVLQVQNVVKSFVVDEILSGVKMEVGERDRVALVGRNGAGKSTLLKIIAGELSFDSGDIIIPKHIRIGYLEQHAGIDSTLSIWEEMLSLFAHFITDEKELRAMEQQMSDPAITGNEERYAKLLADYDQKQTAFKDAGGYQYESDIRSVLHGMQFYPADFETPIQSLSGGQKTRLALAKLLLTKPDLLILDEPTNHLDMDTLAWLEKYLQGYPGAILIVSHDRYFLDQVVDYVYEVSRHQVSRYVGNYSAYLDQKAANYERDKKLFEKQQSEKAKLEEFVQKNIARASTTKMAQSRRKVLEKTDWMEAPDGKEKSANFGFGLDKQSGNDVLSIRDLTVGYDGNPTCKEMNVQVYREDRIAIVGPNGVGKSTLLKTIVKDLPPIKGTIHYGTNVQFGYYDQQQAKLTGNRTVLRELWDEWPLMNEKDIRSILGRFLFSGDDVEKPISSLSGGEKARVALAKLMLLKSNTLILDEPTNHLDLDSKIVLENALLNFPGTILFVSHDRYFINRIANKVLEVTPNGTTLYLGDYDYYVEKKLEQAEIAALTKTEDEKRPAISTSAHSQIDKEAKKRIRQITRQMDELENAMQRVEESIGELHEKLLDPDITGDHEALYDIQQSIEAEKEQQDLLELEWLELQQELDTLNE